MEAAAVKAVDAVIEARSLPLLATGMFATLYQIAEGIRAKGHGGDDFNADNALMVAGGLKGAALPTNYREYVLETFNVSEERLYHMYSMREINATFPLCQAGRYHVSPWVIMLPLDVRGEQLLDTGGGEIEARAAFFDTSIEGRWGGVISGDRVTVSFASATAATRARPSAGRSPATPTCPAATRSPARAASTRTCEVSHELHAFGTALRAGRAGRRRGHPPSLA